MSAKPNPDVIVSYDESAVIAKIQAALKCTRTKAKTWLNRCTGDEKIGIQNGE